MPSSFTTWRCDKCRSKHFSYEDARRCEHQHIVDDAVDGLKADLKRIFNRTPNGKLPKPEEMR